MKLGMLLKPSFSEDASEPATVEVEVKVAQADADAAGLAESIHEVESIAAESDEIASQAEIVESVKEVVAEEGYTRGVARLVESLGLTEAITYSRGYSIAGHESLNTMGRNEEMASRIISGCEGILADWGKKIADFFRMIGRKLGELWTWIKSKFTSYEKTLGRLISDVGSKTISKEKADGKKMKCLTDATRTSLADKVRSLIELQDDLSGMGWDAQNVTVDKNLSAFANLAQNAKAGIAAMKKAFAVTGDSEDFASMVKIEIKDADREEVALENLKFQVAGAQAVIDSVAALKVVEKLSKQISIAATSVEKAAAVLDRAGTGSADMAAESKLRVNVLRLAATVAAKSASTSATIVGILARDLIAVGNKIKALS